MPQKSDYLCFINTMSITLIAKNSITHAIRLLVIYKLHNNTEYVVSHMFGNNEWIEEFKMISNTPITCSKYGLPNESRWNDVATLIILSSILQRPVYVSKKTIIIISLHFQFVWNVHWFLFGYKRRTRI